MFASGHYRNGVLRAPLTARLVADAILEGRVDPLMAALGPSRF
jgi:glycine oxidase